MLHTIIVIIASWLIVGLLMNGLTFLMARSKGIKYPIEIFLLNLIIWPYTIYILVQVSYNIWMFKRMIRKFKGALEESIRVHVDEQSKPQAPDQSPD